MSGSKLNVNIRLNTPLKMYLDRACLKTDQGFYIGKKDVISHFAKAITALAKSGMENSGLTEKQVIQNLKGQTITLVITFDEC
ncbi:hypothetical protein O0S10_01550 [Methanocorpusculum sp. MG]|uniref:Uncharacterized protein n=1 Tax=Methanocorpusculum petauri TaxID=3002863 RepID=A0ABT4IDU7_9EURY|nr:hypothetical protein [Methanocorpusculum petauri]MCZ0859911.1 hypothetical protein [Methanocorpusculum petauri]